VAMGYECKGGFKDLFTGINFKTLVATFGFYVPMYRGALSSDQLWCLNRRRMLSSDGAEFLLYSGMADASRFSAKKLLEDKMSIALVPGGATEALYVSPEKDVLYLKNRKGFIKLGMPTPIHTHMHTRLISSSSTSSAMEHGTPIVPVFSFNENCTYKLYQGGNKFINDFKRRFQRVFGLTLPMVLNVVPKRAKITVVVGQPVDMPLNKDPSPEEVDRQLEVYIAKLKELYDANKDKYNDSKSKQLVII
jgi:2-acylglycerol O-acyltransferase 2